MIKSLRAAACVAVVITLSACSGGSDTSTSAPSTTASSTPAPTTTTPSATTPSAVPSAPPAKPARTAAQLAKALLALADLPPGFSVEKDEGGDDSDVTVSSKDARCAKLVAFSNADNPPGSKASAGQSYSGGAQGPWIDESIDAMGSPAAVRALQKSFKQAVAACRTMTLKVPGEGSSPISIREVAAPDAGTDPVAVRFTATAGPLEGFEVTMITTGVDDVVLAITVINGLPEDIDGATATAVEKAQDILGATKSGT
ncbi:hypothetical protein ACIBL3_43630 [Kribbella sp. NPDC050124]|uniref:hypothetical protein n=1 Tax=Kribbella sp. NPDC050124 TaxID=3364114 RepID=UPI0037B91666